MRRCFYVEFVAGGGQGMGGGQGIIDNSLNITTFYFNHELISTKTRNDSIYITTYPHTNFFY